MATVSIAPLDANKAEGNSGVTPFTFVIRLDQSLSSTVTVDYRVGQTTRPKTSLFELDATADDFVGGAFPTGTVTFLPGETSKIVTIDVAGDLAFESMGAPETFAVFLSNPTNGLGIDPDSAGGPNPVEGQIVNDETQTSIYAFYVFGAGGSPAVGIPNKTAPEGSSGSVNWSFVIRRFGILAPESVTYSVSGTGENPATASDFIGGFPQGVVTFAAGEAEKTVQFSVVADGAFEPNETFAISLSNPTVGTIGDTSAFGTIINDDAANGDINDNLVFQHSTTGGVYAWKLNASGILAGGDLGVPGSTWVAADASSDYNADGLDDIIFQNTANGEVYLWLQNGFVTSSQKSLGVPGIAWQIADSGDINGDGNDDILFQNTGTGEVYAWLQNGLTTTATGSLGVPGIQWALRAAADLDGDGRSELIFQNTGPTGEIYVWQQNGLTTTSTFSLGAPGAAWEIQGSGDFDDSGSEDIVFRNANTGEVYIWLINVAGTGILGQGSVGFANGWSIVGTGDYDGDAHSDLSFQNDTTGAVFIWHLSGTTFLSGQDLGIAAGWNVV